MIELRVGETLEVAGARITPVEKLSIQSLTGARAGWWYGHKELYALVIETASGVRAFDQNGREVSFDELIDEIPLLDGVVRSP